MWPKFFEWKESYLKYSVLQIFSLILVIFALALLSTSNVVSNRKPETIDELTKLNADKESIALTFTSFLIILTAFIGSCGAYNKSKLILIFFCVLLLLLISIEVLCTYVSLRYNYKLKNAGINQRFQDLTSNYEWIESSDIHFDKLVDEIQFRYNCCGTHSYTSWDHLRPHNLSADTYPQSCCYNSFKNLTNWCTTSQVNGTNSCFSSLDEKLNSIKGSVSVMVGITITNSVIKLIGVPVVWYFGRQFPSNYIV